MEQNSHSKEKRSKSSQWLHRPICVATGKAFMYTSGPNNQRKEGADDATQYARSPEQAP
jgi:hypothetical protein